MMISLEAWKGRIGVSNWFLVQSLDILWAIFTLLVAAVILVSLIVGGVEVHPGPPRKDLISSSEEDIYVPKCIGFSETSIGKYVFSALITLIINVEKVAFLLALKRVQIYSVDT